MITDLAPLVLIPIICISCLWESDRSQGCLWPYPCLSSTDTTESLPLTGQGPLTNSSPTCMTGVHTDLTISHAAGVGLGVGVHCPGGVLHPVSTFCSVPPLRKHCQVNKCASPPSPDCPRLTPHAVFLVLCPRMGFQVLSWVKHF